MSQSDTTDITFRDVAGDTIELSRSRSKRQPQWVLGCSHKESGGHWTNMLLDLKTAKSLVGALRQAFGDDVLDLAPEPDLR